MKKLIAKFRSKILRLKSQKIPTEKDIEKENKILKSKEKALEKNILGNVKKKNK